jgi:hypothetical protein
MYEIPFGLFVGVNNNFETILLGGVLMTDEKVNSFKWVFSQFFQLMGGKQPQTILTGQIAFYTPFPTQYCFCSAAI